LIRRDQYPERLPLSGSGLQSVKRLTLRILNQLIDSTKRLLVFVPATTGNHPSRYQSKSELVIYQIPIAVFPLFA
jgi:hypothetical protein